MQVQLSKRLQTVADMVPRGSTVIDVGTDHALIPIYLVTSGATPMAIASDVALGPFEAATRNVERFGLQSVISVRLGSGLCTVQPGEAKSVIIAGMGGSTAVEICEESREVADTIDTLIVQPMNAFARIRAWLMNNRFGIAQETIVYEDKRAYQIIRGERNVDVNAHYRDLPHSDGWLELALEVGPTILLNWRAHETYLQDILTHWISTLESIRQSESAASSEKAHAYRRRVMLLTQLLTR